jgi:hypothetical protein
MMTCCVLFDGVLIFTRQKRCHTVIGARTVRGIRMVQADTYTVAKREGYCGAGRDTHTHTHKHVVARACVRVEDMQSTKKMDGMLCGLTLPLVHRLPTTVRCGPAQRTLTQASGSVGLLAVVACPVAACPVLAYHAAEVGTAPASPVEVGIDQEDLVASIPAEVGIGLACLAEVGIDQAVASPAEVGTGLAAACLAEVGTGLERGRPAGRGP